MKYCRKEDNVFYHTVMTSTKTKTNTNTNFQEEWVNDYRLEVSHGQPLRLRCPLLMTPSAVQCQIQHKDEDEDKDKDKDKMT